MTVFSPLSLERIRTDIMIACEERLFHVSTSFAIGGCIDGRCLSILQVELHSLQ